MRKAWSKLSNSAGARFCE